MKNRFLPLILALASAACLAYLVKDFIRDVIVLPLLYVFWYLTLFLRSLPQFLFWAIFILVALIMALRSLSRERDERGSKIEPPALGGPVAVWSRLIHHAEAGGYSRWQLSQSLARLTWELVGDGERLTTQQIDTRLRRGELDLPPEIRAYFQAGMAPYQPISRLKRRLLGNHTNTPLDLNPEQVIQYLEEKLDPLTGDSV